MTLKLPLGPLAALASFCVMGCADAPTAQKTEMPPLTPPRVMALRGEVDFDRGTLTFSPAPIGGSLISAAIYGDQDVTLQLYNTPVVITQPTPTTGRFEAQVGVRNLLSHPIGDEQAGPSPPDTSGIFVFFTSGPVVTAPTPCAGCTVTMVSHHGARTFTAPNQKYVHWQERLADSGSAGDTTRLRTTWRFDASAAVTGFRFDVLVSAAWPPPDDTRWAVEYPADSLPESGSEPRWRIRQLGAFSSHSASGGLLTLTSGAFIGREMSVYRRDSVTSGANAYAEASMQYNGSSTTLAEPWLVIDDATRFVALGVRSNAVGFINTSRQFIGTPFAMTTTTAQNTYQLRKYAADSAVFYVNGTRRGQIGYTSLSTTNYGATAPLIQFGNITATTSFLTSSSTWDYVIYEIGAASP